MHEFLLSLRIDNESAEFLPVRTKAVYSPGYSNPAFIGSFFVGAKKNIELSSGG